MSDTETPTVPAAGKSDAMPQQDVDFLITCIKNANGGVLTVDAKQIAAQLGYQNPRSVTNKISILKKKYGLAISTAGSKGAGPSDAGAAGAAAAVPKTPAPPKTPKGKVTKAKAAPKGSAKKAPAKAKAAPKSAVKVKVEEAESEEAGAEEDEEMEDAEESRAGDADEV